MSSCGLFPLLLIVRLFVASILYKLFIKNIKIYRHRYLSIIIILEIEVFIFSSITDKKGNKDYFKKLELLASSELSFLIKYICGSKYLSLSNNTNIILKDMTGSFNFANFGDVNSILIILINHFCEMCSK